MIALAYAYHDCFVAMRRTLKKARRFTAAAPKPPKAPEPPRLFRRRRRLGDDRLVAGLRVVPDGKPRVAA